MDTWLAYFLECGHHQVGQGLETLHENWWSWDQTGFSIIFRFAQLIFRKVLYPYWIIMRCRIWKNLNCRFKSEIIYENSLIITIWIFYYYQHFMFESISELWTLNSAPMCSSAPTQCIVGTCLTECSLISVCLRTWNSVGNCPGNLAGCTACQLPCNTSSIHRF